MNNFQWDTQFVELFERCLARYRAGDDDFSGYYTEEDHQFLTAIGYKPREFFDFVEDFGDGGSPSLTSAVMIASVRRDYLRWEMGGELSDHEIKPSDLPSRDAELGGFTWLPRILMKARAKLRGELDPDIMFCCGGDRAFLSKHNLAPADFLRAVWSIGDEDEKIVGFVEQHANG